MIQLNEKNEYLCTKFLEKLNDRLIVRLLSYFII